MAVLLLILCLAGGALCLQSRRASGPAAPAAPRAAAATRDSRAAAAEAQPPGEASPATPAAASASAEEPPPPWAVPDPDRALARRNFAASPRAEGHPMREEFRLRLVTHEIDTSRSSAYGRNTREPQALTADLFAGPLPARPAGPRLPFIVQFEAPVRDAWKARITEAGGVIRGYLPNNALIVDLTRDAWPRVAGASEVQWVGPFRPEFKVQPFLAHLCDEAAPAALVASIETFDPIDAPAVAEAVQAGGGEVYVTLKSGRRGLVRAQIKPDQVEQLAGLPAVAWIEEFVPPELSNNFAVRGDHMNITNVWNAHGLSGTNQIIGHADTGLDTGTNATIHPDFAGKIVAAYGRGIGRSGNWGDPDGHGTHTAGSILGSGRASSLKYRGSAYQARIVHQSVMDRWGFLTGIPADLGQLFAQTYAHGARIHSDSWGSAASGTYNIESSYCDEYMWNYPEMLLVFAAGNEGVDADRDGIVDGRSIGAPATAKNILTVGAAENGRAPNTGGYTAYTYGGAWASDYPVPPLSTDYLSQSPSGNPQGLAAFSSRGPCDDGRVKPDITAPGTDIISCRSRARGADVGWGLNAENTNYVFMGGTSMATPLTAGAAALVRQFYVERKGLTNPPPSAALIKATMLAGARSLTPGQYGTGAAREIPPAPRPNNAEGWGQVNIEGTLFPAAPRKLLYLDRETLATGQTNEYTLGVSSAAPLSIVVAYSDYPAELSAGRKLVNDLDVTLHSPGGQVYYASGGTGPDRVNNVEGVDLAAPAPGTYTLRIAGFSVPMGPQPYALVISGDATMHLPGNFRLESAAVSADEESGTVEFAVIRDGGSSGTVSVEYATANGSAQAGSDFEPASGTLVFPEGTLRRSVQVTLLPDTAPEGDETFSLVLSNPAGGALLGAPAGAVVTILDDDSPGTLALDAAAYAAPEQGPPLEVSVRRTGGAKGTVTCRYATRNVTALAGKDYTAASGLLTFDDGVRSQSFAVPVLNDASNEFDEVFTVAISNATGGAVIGSPAEAEVALVDDDSVTNVVFSESFDAGAPAGWTVVANGGPAAVWRFDDPSARGNLTGGSGGFAIADSDNVGDVLMDTELRTPVLDLSSMDTAYLAFRMDFRWWFLADDEIADVDISTNGAAGPWANVGRVRGYSLRGPVRLVRNITGVAAGQRNVMVRFRYYQAQWEWWLEIDDVEVYGLYSPLPQPGTLRFRETASAVPEGQGHATIEVIRTGGSDGPVSVQYSTAAVTAAAGEDFQPATGTLNFEAGQTSRTFSVTILQDELTEPGETLELRLASAGGGAGIGQPAVSTLRILDDDPVHVTVLSETFSDGAAPAGWAVRPAGGAVTWRFDDPGARTNQTGGSGGFAIADNAYFATNMDAELVTPVLNLAMLETAALEFRTDFRWYRWDQDEIADVDVSTGGVNGPWQNVWRQRGDDLAGPQTVQVDLTAAAAGRTNVAVRFRYYQAAHEYWWQVDNVILSGNAFGGTADRDVDGLPDWWEVLFYGEATVARADDDTDGDFVKNRDEYYYGADPRKKDTDADGYGDRLEILRGSNPAASSSIPITSTRIDFDGDRRADIGCYYPPGGNWYIMKSRDGFWVTTFGYTGTTPVAGDFDGDGRCDFGCYFAPGGNWYLMQSRSGFWTTSFGYAGTVPVTGDFDGDGREDYGCYFAPGGNWYLMQSRDGFRTTAFGYAGTVPVVGDFDGDSVTDYGCYYAPGGNWYFMQSSRGFLTRQFGYTGTVPVVGDFDGDGVSDYGCYYAPGGNWYLMQSRDGFRTTAFGYAGTVPVVGDFDGDGRDDYGCYYAPGGNWYLMQSRAGFWTSAFGYAGTIPLGSP